MNDQLAFTVSSWVVGERGRALTVDLWCVNSEGNNSSNKQRQDSLLYLRRGVCGDAWQETAMAIAAIAVSCDKMPGTQLSCGGI